MSTLIVTDRQGEIHSLEGVEGWRVMEILRDYKVGVEGTCGGSCDCGTCHVIIDPAYALNLPEPREEELNMLDSLPFLYPTSRLSCQLIFDENMHGLKLTLADV